MKQKHIWIRRKKEKGKLATYVVEGSTSKKKILLWTISQDLTSLIQHLIKTSFFTKEKEEKIQQKLDSLVSKPERVSKQQREVPINNIIRTLKNDCLHNQNVKGGEL